MKKTTIKKQNTKVPPLTTTEREKLASDRKEVKDILSSRDDRMLVIVGPCSAWPERSVLVYAEKLKKLEKKLSPYIKIVMRTYTQKPRTSTGWAGPLVQPDPQGIPDVKAGLEHCKGMLTKVIRIGLPVADEMLFTHMSGYIAKLASWVAIGARSAEDPEHRILASNFNCSVGLKNPTSGSIEIGVNSVIVAQAPHTAIYGGKEMQTKGNRTAHIVLRGGEHRPNYDVPHIEETISRMEKNKIANPSIIIDASHDNSKINGVKNYLQQIVVVQETLRNLENNPSLRHFVKGFMIESFLKEGKQALKDGLAPDLGGLSITDPCLDFEQTTKLLEEIAENVKYSRGIEIEKTGALLPEMRIEIEKIDKTIVDLLATRTDIARSIGKVKRAEGKPVFDEERERKLLQILEIESKDKAVDSELVKKVFKLVFTNSRKIQCEIRDEKK